MSLADRSLDSDGNCVCAFQLPKIAMGCPSMDKALWLQYLADFFFSTCHFFVTPFG